MEIAPRTALRVLLLVWGCFWMRGIFYAILFPLWEGYDEYSHFAYVQFLAVHGELPLVKETRISREVQESLLLVPLPRMLRLPPPHVSHDTYWTLTPEERQRRQRQLASLPQEWASQPSTENHTIYEALHPPLYYALLSLPLRAFDGASLAARVISLRLLSMALGSLVIPLGFLVTRRVLGHDGLALTAMTVVAVMPELMIDICRVANECLAIVLYTLMVYLSLNLAEGKKQARRIWLLGMSLGLGLLTKAYFLAALPTVFLLILWNLRRARGGRLGILLRGAGALALATTIAGWWYWRNYLLTGAIFWQPGGEAYSNLPLIEFLHSITRVDWREVLDSVCVSHIWFGNWSFLQVRSWMYHTIQFVALLAGVGLLKLLGGLLGKRGKQSSLLFQPAHLFVLITYYVFFCLGLAYHVLVLRAITGLAATQGWYLYALVVPEVTLVTLGLFALFPVRWRRVILPTITSGFALLDLYATNFLLIPYYVGLIAHRPDGHLGSFHVSQLAEVGPLSVLQRLQINKPGFLTVPILAATWILYVAATLGLVALCVRLSRREISLEPDTLPS
jgi:4-amino-4-deoxy-L-arabinose transferase-like glycosyltransferase